MTDTKLIDAAIDARQRAYAPYSNFLVGAAVRGLDGTLFGGCNVENASYGLTICAERVAATNAVAAGTRDWQALAVVTLGGLAPCGACRQFLAEFAAELIIYIVDANGGHVQETTLTMLLPQTFRLRP